MLVVRRMQAVVYHVESYSLRAQPPTSPLGVFLAQHSHAFAPDRQA